MASIAIEFVPAAPRSLAPAVATPAPSETSPAPAVARWLKRHLTFAHVLLFAGGLICGSSITLGLRIIIPQVIHAVSMAPATPQTAGLDLSDPAYDLKIMPKAVWNIPAPLEVDIQRAKAELDQALSEGRQQSH
ncbi:MAG TPA: hypothetical protein VGB82_10570 [Alphaproteobacteria bacterium]